MLGHIPNPRVASRGVLLVVSILLLLGSIVTSEASAYYSLTKESQTTVSSPPVELQEGTTGNSTIYTNGTSAKVSVETSGAGVTDVEDYVDNNISDIDNSTDIGTHSNFTAQKYGPDLINDTLTEGNITANYEYLWISGGDDYVRKLDKSDPGGTEILGWDTGTSYPFGCEFRIENGNEYIYIVDYGSGVDALIKFHANNGTEVTRWDISGYSGDVRGLAWNGSRWFIADSADDLIYQVDPDNATNYERSFSYSGIGICEGLAWDGSYLWAADTGTDTVYQIDIYGNISTSWSLTNPTGIAYDTTSGHLWIVGAGAEGYLYEYYINGTEIDNWDPSGTYPEGVAYSSIDYTNYQLDLEVQWTNVDHDETNEELAIFAYEGNNTHSLDATGGYMIVGDGTPDWGSTTGTISFWIKWNTMAMPDSAWGQHDNMEARVATWSNGTHMFQNLRLDWGAENSLTSETNFTIGKWYFVAIVWDENSNNLYLYVGDQDNPPVLDDYDDAWASTVSTVGVTGNNFIASQGGVNPTDGHGDDLRYWNTNRTLADIQNDYNADLSGFETSLKSYFKLNNNFYDLGPDGSDGSGSGSYSFSSDVAFDAAPSEDIGVDVWNGSSWQNLATDLIYGWNNISVSSYLDSSNFTIRFRGGTETGDTTQDTWQVDVTLLHLWFDTGVLGNATTVTTNATSRSVSYGKDRAVLRTTDASNTLHVFQIDSNNNLQWWKSTNNGTTWSKQISSGFGAVDHFSVKKDSSNYIHVAYASGSGSVYYRKQLYNATSWGGSVTISSDGESYQPDVAIAPYNKSWVYVVYDNHAGAPAHNEVWVRTSTDCGTSFGSAVELTYNEFSYTGTFPSIVIDNTLGTYGHVYATWYRGSAYLYLRRGRITSIGTVNWDGDSNVQTISSGMSTNLTENTNMMHSAMYANGKYRVVYCESGTAKYRDWDESSWSSPISLATVSHYPSITYDWNNYIYVFYHTDDSNPNYDIRYQRSSDKIPTDFDPAQNVTDDNNGNNYVSTKLGGDNNRVEFAWTNGTSPYGVRYNYITEGEGAGPGQTDFNYISKFLEKDNSNWTVRLTAYDNSSLSRLSNCSIYIYNGSNSTQIVILNGDYENQTGPWVDLNASDTEYIWMHVETSSAGTSYIYVHLEIRIPDTTTYLQYKITFEIT